MTLRFVLDFHHHQMSYFNIEKFENWFLLVYLPIRFKTVSALELCYSSQKSKWLCCFLTTLNWNMTSEIEEKDKIIKIKNCVHQNFENQYRNVCITRIQNNEAHDNSFEVKRQMNYIFEKWNENLPLGLVGLRNLEFESPGCGIKILHTLIHN